MTKDATVRPPTITVRVEVPSPNILMRTHLWQSWARIAIDHEAMAKAAREKLEQAAPEDRDGYMLQQEADAGLVAICAAAFAVEAFSRQLDELSRCPRRHRRHGSGTERRPKGGSWSF